MAKKAASKTPPKAQPPAEGEGLNRERFEKELQSLAKKAKTDAEKTPGLEQGKILAHAALLLSLLGVYAVVSQKMLSPVYGDIPASLKHTHVLMAGCFIGWAGNLFLRNMLPSVKTTQLLPLVAAYVPALQYVLTGYDITDKMGAVYGPAFVESVTLLPLCVLTASSVADLLEGVNVNGVLPDWIADALPGIGSWGVFKMMRMLAAGYLGPHMGRSLIYTRLGLETVLAGIYAVLAPSKYLYLAVPALLHTAFFNTHLMTPMATTALNTTLQADNWLLLDRKESVTGYISVLESLDNGYRVLRCDHSLLGGEWTLVGGKVPVVKEPIYGVFVMLEAVRLVKREEKVRDKDASALVIGLGIGTTPSSLVQHGIDTTVVEIDPVVHEYAVEYFGLKENNPAALVDAVSYTQRLVQEEKTYDYIVHDVFTGGAEPVALFTQEFLQGLSALLKPDGVIAINYAGDLSHPAPKIVVNTIKSVFPTCRIFRESPPEPSVLEASGMDFTNMVIFCKKQPASEDRENSGISFRRPVMEDFLQSRARQMFLEPKHEVTEGELGLGSVVGEEKAMNGRKKKKQSDGILRVNSTEEVVVWQEASALGHWAVMRTVLPPKIWEMW